MSLQIKIQGGTPKAGKGLCHTCKGAVIVRGQNCEEHITCQLGAFASANGYSGRVTFRVAECGKYHPSNMPWLNEMEAMAWIVEARRRGPSGFQAPPEPLEVTIKPPESQRNYPQTPSPSL